MRNRSLFLQWLDRYGKEHIILGADARDGKISINGWLEESEWELIPYVREYAQAGVYKVITTDISRDGMLEGCAVNLYESMLSEIPEIYLIASRCSCRKIGKIDLRGENITVGNIPVCR